ncbi:porin [Methylotetracoccus oryzae]|uniref:porin n=1 Tax=Methylotetracoccus oryzae TaxID=1919059 RepID=UPI001118629F|nr:porin [Methylotetracoccus oryzae]
MTKNRNAVSGLAPIICGLLSAAIAVPGLAKDIGETTGFADWAFGDPNESDFMKNLGLKIGAWINVGVSTNFNNSPGNFNGPVTFGDRTGELQLNQTYFYIQREVAGEGDDWDVGFRGDFMFGTDAIFTQAYGAPQGHWDLNLWNERFLGTAIPQAYLEVYAPFGNGITAKIGHFYTIIGYEVVTAPDNFFYSHAYTMQYGEPFTHTGVLFSYNIDDQFSFTGGGVTGSQFGGWDGGFDQGMNNWAFLGGLTYKNTDWGTTLAATGTAGDANGKNPNNVSIYSLVAQQDITEDLHFVLQHDHGFADQAAIDASGKVQNATWYGINSYLFYDMTDTLGVGIRGEWFRDDDGTRVFSPGRTLGQIQPNAYGFNKPASYYEVTLGLNWKPLQWVMVRPNIRYDWSDSVNAFNNGGADVGYQGNRKDQLLFSTDVVVTF